MKSIYITISILVLIICFSSCEKEIEFSGEIKEPLIVLNSFVTPDSVISAHISKTRFFLSSSTDFTVITSAEVSLYVNGIQKEKLIHKQNGYYKGSYKPVSGDTIRLEVKASGFETVYAQAVVQPQVEILSVDTTLQLSDSYPIYNQDIVIGHQNFYKCIFKVKFKDPSIKNFYRLTVRTHYEYSIGQSYDDYSFNFDDIVSGNSTNAINIDGGNNQYNIFSDELFDGKDYTLTFSTNMNKNIMNAGYEEDSIYNKSDKKDLYVNLQSVDENMYRYLKTRANSNNDSFLSEPVQIYSNIKGGVGIIGSYNSHVIKY